MFLGEYRHSLDDKGRLTLPSKFRDKLASGVVVTRGLDGCLFVFSLDMWQASTKTLNERLPFTQKSARDFSRFLYSGASDMIPDKQGRILIPSFLREYADLQSEVVVIGADTRIEVWNPERWGPTLFEVEANAEQIAEQFGNMAL
jgi:MraZ protein